MPGPLKVWGLAALLCAAVALVWLPGVASAQDLDCNSACEQYLAQEGLGDPQAKSTCLERCAKLKEMGVGGIGIKCMYALPKACGYELAWDFISHCFKPCIEFKEKPCAKCLIKYSYCHQGTACRAKICDCIIKHNCKQMMKKICQ
jgi:hypothetical protein